jgi:hypothetical protein
MRDNLVSYVAPSNTNNTLSVWTFPIGFFFVRYLVLGASHPQSKKTTPLSLGLFYKLTDTKHLGTILSATKKKIGNKFTQNPKPVTSKTLNPLQDSGK